MPQHFFSAETAPTLVNLDANFSAVYDVREHISTPAYTASNPLLALDSTQFWTMQMTYGGGSFLPGLTLGNGASGVAGMSPALGFSAGANINAGIWSSRYVGPGGDLVFGTQAIGGGDPVARMRVLYTGVLQPETDNAQTLGAAAKRWSVVYAGTGTINTSDAREKTAVDALSASEVAAAAALSAEIGTYRWLAAVQDKGAGARMHVGLTVQRAIAVMTAHGLEVPEDD